MLLPRNACHIFDLYTFKVSCGSGLNGHQTPSQNGKGKKRNEVSIDPAAMYESLKNRIAALEEEEVLEEEEERRFGAFLA
jgi:hypothetical protein